MLSAGSISAQPNPSPKLSTEQWQQDLRYLAARLPVVHPNLFHRVSRKDFDAAVERLNRRIPELEPHQILVEFARLTALIGEVHTGIMVHRQPREVLASLRGFPIRLYWYEDGLFVQAIEAGNAKAAGLRVKRIGNVEAGEALRRVGQIIPADNEMWIKRYGPAYLGIAEVQHALGMISSRAETTFNLQDRDGKEFEISLKASPLGEVIEFLNPLTDPQPRVGLTTALTGPTPLWLKDQRNRYWFEYLKEDRSLYLQINTMLDKEGETMEQFYDRALSAADSEKVERLIIDIRQNNGGNHLALPLIHGLIRRPHLNQKGKLFVIIGRGTVSAGQNLATLLEIHTNALFVGEPTSSRPNQYGVVGTFSLPNSKIFVWHSRFFIQDSNPGDFRPCLEPDIAAPLTSQDYLSHRDPAINAILSYRALPPLMDTLETTYANGGIAKVMDQYRELATRYKETGRSTERDLNRLGYRLLAKGKQQDAIAVFELNVREHPKSFNVYDSLGDAYLRAGNRVAGLKNYERSVELNPENEYAKRLLAAEAVNQ